MPFKLRKILIKIFFADFTYCNGLFEKIIFDYFFAGIVQSIRLFVHGVLIVSLVENSFPHVLILLHSCHFLNVFIYDFKQIFVCLFLNMSLLVVFVFVEFVFLLKKVIHVIFSQFFYLFVDFTFHLLGISKFVSQRVNTCAYLFSKSRKCAARSDGSKKFKH